MEGVPLGGVVLAVASPVVEGGSTAAPASMVFLPRSGNERNLRRPLWLLAELVRACTFHIVYVKTRVRSGTEYRCRIGLWGGGDSLP